MPILVLHVLLACGGSAVAPRNPTSPSEESPPDCLELCEAFVAEGCVPAGATSDCDASCENAEAEVIGCMQSRDGCTLSEECGGPAESGCTNTCPFAFDGACDDGGPGADFSVCSLGTDCDDCGPRQGVPSVPTDPNCSCQGSIQGVSYSLSCGQSTPCTGSENEICGEDGIQVSCSATAQVDWQACHNTNAIGECQPCTRSADCACVDDGGVSFGAACFDGLCRGKCTPGGHGCDGSCVPDAPDDGVPGNGYCDDC